MKTASEQIGNLQAVQWELIEFIKTNTTNDHSDELVHKLKVAITALNDAKGIIMDRAIAEGKMQIVDSSDGSHLKNELSQIQS